MRTAVVLAAALLGACAGATEPPAGLPAAPAEPVVTRTPCRCPSVPPEIRAEAARLSPVPAGVEAAGAPEARVTEAEEAKRRALVRVLTLYDTCRRLVRVCVRESEG